MAVDTEGYSSIVDNQTYIIDKTAPTAGANLNSGLYNTNKVVTLSMSEKGTIYYTTNGAMPTTASKKYTGPITITSTTNLKFIAVDLAGNKSPVYAKIYTIDKTAPKITSTIPINNANNVSLTSAITIKFSENLVKGANYSKIYIKNLTDGKLVAITTKLTGNTVTIKMTHNRFSLNTYEVCIPTSAVKDNAGNNNTQYTLKFETSKY